MKQNTDRPFVGMARVVSDISDVVPVTSAWVFVYSDRGSLSYSVAGSVGSDILSSPRYNMKPENVALMAPQLNRVADVWSGYADPAIIDEVVGKKVMTGSGPQFACSTILPRARQAAPGNGRL